MAIIYESTILNFLWIARFLCNTLKDAFKLHTFSLICTAGRLSNPNYQVEYCPPPELALADMAYSVYGTDLGFAKVGFAKVGFAKVGFANTCGRQL